MIKNRSLASGGFGTHIVPLIAAVLATQQHIFEFGMGDYSTPLLHEIIKYQRSSCDRKIFSYESDMQWLANFSDLDNDWHKINLIHDWENIDITPNIGVLFIDHAPAERRIVDIEKYQILADIIVVHDTEKHSYYKYEPLLSNFKFRKDYERYSKKTTLISNFINVTKLL